MTVRALVAPWRQVGEVPPAIRVIALGAFVNRLGSLVLPFLALFLGSRHLGAAAVGTGVAAFGVGKVLAAPSGGWLADHLGARITTVGSMILGSATMLGLLLAPGHGAALTAAAALLAGWASELYRPGVARVIQQEVTDPEGRANAFAVYQLGTTLGLTIGPALGGALAAIGYELLFAVEIITSLAWAALGWRALPDDRVRHPAAARGGGSLRQVSADRPLLRFLAASLLINTVLFQAQTALPVWLHHAGHGPLRYGWLLALSSAIVVLTQLPLADRTRRRRPGAVQATGHVLAAAGFGLLALGDALPVLVVAVALFSLGESLAWPSAGAWLTNHAPEHLVGQYAGLRSLTFGLGLAIAPVSQLFVTSAPAATWLLVAAVAVVAALLVRSLPAPDPHTQTTRRIPA